MNKIIIESDADALGKYITEYGQEHEVKNIEDALECKAYVRKRMLEEADLDNFEVHVFNSDYDNYVTW